VNERLAIVGSGAIACGLAATAAHHGSVQLFARSDDSAERARSTLQKLWSRSGEEPGPMRIEVVSEIAALADATFIVEAIVEDHDIKAELLADLDRRVAHETVLATTTSSLSIQRLAEESGRPQRFVGLHVFNPVSKMKLVELVFPKAATERTRTRAFEFCQALDKTAVEVPDVPGFVVNRLLFPYLFSAVRLLEQTGMHARDVDTCMRMGAGHPMGPLALLDLVGLDVSKAIGETIGESIPPSLEQLVSEGALGRKSGRGFHTY
jgi:3-hydroxybutyryl-CoA dehydrogenase